MSELRLLRRLLRTCAGRAARAGQERGAPFQPSEVEQALPLLSKVRGFLSRLITSERQVYSGKQWLGGGGHGTLPEDALLVQGGWK